MSRYFTTLDDLARMSDAYIVLKVRELTHWHANAQDGSEWKNECAAQLAAFKDEMKIRETAREAF